MANFSQQSQAYARNSNLPSLFPDPIVSQRAPVNGSDKGLVGQAWIDQTAQDVYMAILPSTWLNLGGGSGVFDNLTVTNNIVSTNGDISSGGDVTATTALSGASIFATGSELTTAPANDTVASPAVTATTNGATFKATFTGFTTAAAGSEVLSIDNTSITPGEGIILSIHNTATANDCLMSLTGYLASAGGIDVTVTNNGTQALDGDIIITGWVIE